MDLVTNLTTEAFIACLRRFIARRGKPNLIRSENGTNFIRANRVLRKLFEFPNAQKTKREVPDFCSSESIEWNSFLNKHLTLAAFGRQLLRTCAINDTFAKRAAISFLSENESLEQYKRKRMSQSFELVTEPKPKKRHINDSFIDQYKDIIVE